MRIVLALVATCVLAAASCARPFPAPRAVSRPIPLNITDDAAFWINPADPALSLLLIANKGRGIEVHDLDGFLRKQLDDGLICKGIDILTAFPFGKGPPSDIALVTVGGQKSGLVFYRIDAAKRKLTRVLVGPPAAGLVLPVLDNIEPVSVCAYTSRSTARQYCFVSSEENSVEQEELIPDGPDSIALKTVRQWQQPNKVKGLVADADAGLLYFADEKAGVFQVSAEPAGGPATCIAPVGTHGLRSEVKGVALLRGPAGSGFLLVSCAGAKGDATIINVYDRRPPHSFICTLAPPGIQESAGVAVAPGPLSAAFPEGCLAVNDHAAVNGNCDFKLFSWAELIKANPLLKLRLNGR